MKKNLTYGDMPKKLHKMYFNVHRGSSENEPGLAAWGDRDSISVYFLYMEILSMKNRLGGDVSPEARKNYKSWGLWEEAFLAWINSSDKRVKNLRDISCFLENVSDFKDTFAWRTTNMLAF